jgi:bacterioferritin
MDKAKLVELMNADLETEYQSIVQYIVHIATIKGAEYQSIVEELTSHLSQELQHAMTLAEQIDFLEGVPTTDVPRISQETDARKALEQDLKLEEGQLERYRERFEQAREAGFPDVAEAIEPLLAQTQDHVRDLRTALGK